ncbi:ABC transporter permease [Pontibacter sp. MBLB2868]|uniref:ABC transporter permease n=1 Tax=Pontibacter sp. MBLB2868 TaxID=3451555 RepID=UPI003F74FCC7
MLHYLFKRLITTLPALWLLATFVFILSRLLPGAAGSEQILQENGGFYSKGNANSRQDAYKAYIKRTGQDLPLFYFSVKAGTEPDTLSLIFPEAERQRLQLLNWRYGNWPAVWQYNQSLKETEVAVLLHANPRQQAAFENLLTAATPEQLRTSMSVLVMRAAGTPSEQAVRKLEQAANQLIEKQNKFAYMFPSFHWHGLNNQYHRWIAELVKGNAGNSYRDQRPVSEVIIESFSNTFWLIVSSILIAFTVSLELSLFLVMRKGKMFRKFFLPLLFILDSIPLFLLALLLLVLFATPEFLQWFPVFGLGLNMNSGLSAFQQLSVRMQYMALPVLCLTLTNIPYLTNLIYKTLRTEKTAGYARTARAKGLSEQQVIRRHVLRNSLLPVITILTDAFPALLAGTVVIETIFAIPGLGRLLVNSVMARDYPIIVAIVIFVAIVRVVAYLVADIGYGLADPRVKQQYE